MQIAQDVIQYWFGVVCVGVVLLVASIALAWFLADAANYCARRALQIARFSVVSYWMHRMQREGIIVMNKHYRQLVLARKLKTAQEYEELDLHCYAAEWAAHNTLEQMGYTYSGGSLWKPPIGQAPDFNLIDQLHAKIAELKKDRDEWQEATIMANDNSERELKRRRELQDERDKLQAKLNELAKQEPVGEVRWAANIPNTIRETYFFGNEPAVGANLYASPMALAPLTKAEVKDLTAMVFGAPCTDEILEWLPRVIAQYEALITTNKRPVDPADEAELGIGGTP